MNKLSNFAKVIAVSTYMRSWATRGEFADLAAKTAILRPGALPRNVCDRLKQRIDAIADEQSHPRIWRDSVSSDTRILGFEKDVPEFLEFFELSRMIRAVDAYTGCKTKSWFLMANRVIPKENSRGSGGGLHRDSAFLHQVKCIWYLSDVGSENGPFQYLPGSNRNLLKNRRDFPLGETRFKLDSCDFAEVTGEAGSLLICDTKCIHGGKPIQSGVRYAVTLYTLPNENGAEKLFAGSGIDPALARHGQVN